MSVRVIFVSVVYSPTASRARIFSKIKGNKRVGGGGQKQKKKRKHTSGSFVVIHINSLEL